MKKFLTIITALWLTLGATAQKAEYFEPYKKTNLRLPSVPLLLNDPYFSFWSPYNKLNGGTTKMWDNQEKAMDGLLRVDGTSYRFMGKPRGTILEAIAPMGNEGAWTAKVKLTTPSTDDWMNLDYTETGWTTQKGPWGTKSEYPYIQTNWTGNNRDIYIRRHVTLTGDQIRQDLYVVYSHDDKCEVYVNGVEIATTEVTWAQNVRVHLTGDAKQSLVAGDNVIAYHVHNTNGGSQADIGLFRNIQGYHNGYTSIAPMADEGAWEAQVTNSTPASNWMNTTFSDKTWNTQQGAFGSANEYPNVNTAWTATGSDIYIRRRINLTQADLQKSLHLIYSHDDVCEAYINGQKLVSTGNTWVQNVDYTLTAADKAALQEGENLLAYHVHNTTGGALADIGLYADESGVEMATQLSCYVLATNTYYQFTCGPVKLDVVFTAPFLMDDPDRMSTPVNYISYQVTPTDGASHDVQFYFGTTPELTVNNNMQATVSTIVERNGVKYIKSGSQEQNVLGTAGDLISIDWGYLYIPDVNGTVTVASTRQVDSTFHASGTLPQATLAYKSTQDSDMPTLAYVRNMGTVSQATSSYMLFGYDEVKDIRYMNVDYKGYWARDGKTITTAFEETRDAYDDIMTRCRLQDQTIYDDGLAAANQKYAELLSGSYRQVCAAHKMFQDSKGNLLYFSKENNSNGCVNTVDLTYPSAPLFLLYNTDLQKGMCTSILDYCESDRWGFDFAAHDLGTYPHANNQVYSIRFPNSDGGFGGNMPIEETGNIVILAAAISLIDGNTDWADTHWATLTKWADYLAENGSDPANQLCTDDFAGHLAHNANLSLKAIMGVAGYALMCQQKGDTLSYSNYMAKAKAMAAQWQTSAREGTHFKLAFDQSDTWSQKYNMVWDKVWNTGLFTAAVINQEFNSYSSHCKTYGIPLDNRADYSKTDWLTWTATLGRTNTYFTRYEDLLWKYVNETTSRVPISDWYWTTSGEMRGFRARSVIGGHWMKVLSDKMRDGTLTGVTLPRVDPLKNNPYTTGWYNLSGQQTGTPTRQGIYLKDGRKVMVK